MNPIVKFVVVFVFFMCFASPAYGTVSLEHLRTYGTSLETPKGVEGCNGNIWVAPQNHAKIYRNGVLVKTITMPFPHDMEYDPSRDIMYVVDRGGIWGVPDDSIRKFTCDGDPLGYLATEISGVNYPSPSGIALDTSGNVYASVGGNFMKFSPSGSLLGTYCFPGFSELGSCNGAIGLTNLPNGNILIANSGTDKVTEYTTSDVFVQEQGSLGPGDDEYNTPFDVEASPVGTWVSERGNHRLKLIDSGLNFVMKHGSQGSGAGQFYAPHGLAYQNCILTVSEIGNERLQDFRVLDDEAPPSKQPWISSFANGVLEFSWTKNWQCDFDRYVIQVSEDGGPFQWKAAIRDREDTSYSFTTNPSTSYEIRLKVCDWGDACSGWLSDSFATPAKVVTEIVFYPSTPCSVRGEQVKLAGNLRDEYGDRLPFAKVGIKRWDDGQWKHFATATTNSNGYYQRLFQIWGNKRFKAVYAGDATHTTSIKDNVWVRGASRIALWNANPEVTSSGWHKLHGKYFNGCGDPVSGKKVYLKQKSGSSFYSSGKTNTTWESGKYVFWVKPGNVKYYRADSGYDRSSWAKMPYFSISTSNSTSYGRTTWLQGHLKTGKDELEKWTRVYLQRWNGSKWIWSATDRTNGDGHFRFSFKAWYCGARYYRVATEQFGTTSGRILKYSNCSK